MQASLGEERIYKHKPLHTLWVLQRKMGRQVAASAVPHHQRALHAQRIKQRKRHLYLRCQAVVSICWLIAQAEAEAVVADHAVTCCYERIHVVAPRLR